MEFKLTGLRRRNKNQNIRIPLEYSLPKAILDILLDFGEHFVLFETPYAHAKRLYREALGIPEPKRWRYNRAIKYLEQRAKLEVKEENNRFFVKLTKKGKLEALLFRLEKDFRQTIQWDGKWRIVIWDIPEDSREYRDKIRWFVKSLGFYQLQKSVFITPYPLPKSAVKYLDESGLIRYIRFVRADKLDSDKFLKRHFKLH